MEAFANKRFILSMIAVVLAASQSIDGNILIDAALILVTLELSREHKKDGKTFSYRLWTLLFILFTISFIIKAFIIN